MSDALAWLERQIGDLAAGKRVVNLDESIEAVRSEIRDLRQSVIAFGGRGADVMPPLHALAASWEALAAEEHPITGANLEFCARELREALAKEGEPSDAAVEAAAHIAECYFGPVCCETGEWCMRCLIPEQSPRSLAVAILRAARDA